MKFVDEYRDPRYAQSLARAIRDITTRPHTIMEVCGGQTHAIVRFGIDELLPEELTLVHGPGCPVCVTPVEIIDKALMIAKQPGVIFCSFGDMLRVPGSRESLSDLRAVGADVRIVYSPLDAVNLAYTELQLLADEERINAIVVMTDGRENNSRISLGALNRSVISGNESGVPVVIFCIGYGSDADVRTLRSLAEASGGQYYTGDLDTIRRLYKILSSYF